MENYFKDIEKRLLENIDIKKIEIINNSHKHRGHKYFSEDKYHLHIKIESSYLNSINRINAQKLVMSILKDDLKNKIHALEISIK